MKVTKNSTPKDSAARADAMIEKVGLTEFRDVYPHMLSGGMKMRVAIGRAMALEPDILLMDEPFARTRCAYGAQCSKNYYHCGISFVSRCFCDAFNRGGDSCRLSIFVLSPHPGRVRAELDSDGLDHNSIGKAEFGHLTNASIAYCLATRGPSGPRGRPGVKTHRPEFETKLADAGVIGDVERPLTVVERVLNNEAVQRLTILVVLIVIWELYARWLNNALLFPTFTETAKTFSKDIANGVLVDRTITSLRTLAVGYALGLALATIVTTFAVASEVGTRILSTRPQCSTHFPQSHFTAGVNLVLDSYAIACVRHCSFGTLGSLA